MDVTAVRSLARRVRDGADRIDHIDWPTIEPDSLMGSAVARATPSPVLAEGVAVVVAHLRTWATAAQAAATAIDAAQLRHARQLGDGR